MGYQFLEFLGYVFFAESPGLDEAGEGFVDLGALCASEGADDFSYEGVFSDGLFGEVVGGLYPRDEYAGEPAAAAVFGVGDDLL